MEVPQTRCSFSDRASTPLHTGGDNEHPVGSHHPFRDELAKRNIRLLVVTLYHLIARY